MDPVSTCLHFIMDEETVAHKFKGPAQGYRDLLAREEEEDLCPLIPIGCSFRDTAHCL